MEFIFHNSYVIPGHVLSTIIFWTAQTLLNKGYVIPRLMVSLQNFYGRHDDLVSSYEICISQKAMDILPY
jgi:hypothetical protein